jgi:aspartyl-tRNA(Asn)/glutamyl-tRNA(Gln) amidotransferase subunit B
MNNFEFTVGVEVHTVLNTKSKMFSSSPCIADEQINTYINEIDLGLPGTLPSPNQQAVIKGVVLAKALGMQIDSLLRFDRKNYFYPDLPKGFQITQQYYPLGKDGTIKLKNDKVIRVERIHLEEDTAKQLTIGDQLCLDYNRCGDPLVEIVSKPDLHTTEEVYEYLTELKRILIFLNISDGKMENGSLRVDLNISVAPIGAKQLGTKVEIKNINSFANVVKAINFEFTRQVRELLKGERVRQETRR